MLLYMIISGTLGSENGLHWALYDQGQGHGRHFKIFTHLYHQTVFPYNLAMAHGQGDKNILDDNVGHCRIKVRFSVAHAKFNHFNFRNEQ